MTHSKEAHQGRRKRIRYTPFDRDLPIDWGDPEEIFGPDTLLVQFKVTHRYFRVKPETVIGRLRAGDDVMDLTADTMFEALELVEFDRDSNTRTGKVMFAIAKDMSPYVTINWDHTPIEEIYPDWPEGIEFPAGSIFTVINDKRARHVAVRMEDVWRARGGDPTHKLDKSGGRKFKNP